MDIDTQKIDSQKIYDIVWDVNKPYLLLEVTKKINYDELQKLLSRYTDRVISKKINDKLYLLPKIAYIARKKLEYDLNNKEDNWKWYGIIIGNEKPIYVCGDRAFYNKYEFKNIYIEDSKQSTKKALKLEED